LLLLAVEQIVLVPRWHHTILFAKIPDTAVPFLIQWAEPCSTDLVPVEDNTIAAEAGAGATIVRCTPVTSAGERVS